MSGTQFRSGGDRTTCDCVRSLCVNTCKSCGSSRVERCYAHTVVHLTCTRGEHGCPSAGSSPKSHLRVERLDERLGRFFSVFCRVTRGGRTMLCSCPCIRCAVGAQSHEATDHVSLTKTLAPPLSKCASRQQSELLGNTLMSFCVELFQEPRLACCGVVADDATLALRIPSAREPISPEPFEQFCTGASLAVLRTFSCFFFWDLTRNFRFQAVIFWRREHLCSKTQSIQSALCPSRTLVASFLISKFRANEAALRCQLPAMVLALAGASNESTGRRDLVVGSP